MPCIRSACILYSNTCDNHSHRNRPFRIIFAHTNYTTNDSIFSVGYTVVTSYCCSTAIYKGKNIVFFFAFVCSASHLWASNVEVYSSKCESTTEWLNIFFFWFIGRGCIFSRNWTHFKIEHRIVTVRMNQCDDFLFASGILFKFHNLKSAFECWPLIKLSPNGNWVECLLAGNVDLFPNCAF